MVLKIKNISVGAFVLALIMLLSACGLAAKEETANVSDYSLYFGLGGKHDKAYLIKNDIFPEAIPSTANVEKFQYCYYNSFDPNYVCYLVYTCDDDEYKAERERLSKIRSSDKYLIYGATGFNYPVCAVHADSYNGYVYALSDEKNKRFIYVEISFCNYFCDVDYTKIISKEFLPIGFDAMQGNATRKRFEEKNK
ncbi:MAG: hypothetical protein Q8942_00635 [Bacillota bacterium]|nr:hypothetical protein [Bacillota bacterium]